MGCIGCARASVLACTVVAACVPLCCGLVATPAEAVPTITEYTAGNLTYAQPLGIVAAPTEAHPDGVLWFTVNETLSPGFGIMTTSGAFEKLDEELLGGNPRELALGPEGDVWVTEDGEHPRIKWGNTAKSPYSISGKVVLPGGSNPIGIAAGPEGEMWFTEGTGTGKIVKVSPTTGKITAEYTTGLLSSGEPAQIVAGADGNMWFAEHGSSGAIGRITPTGTITLFKTGLTSSSGPWSLVLGPEGDIWFTEFSAGGKIGRITPTGTITEFTGSTDGEPGDIVAGDNGDMYFTERGSEKKAGHEGALAQITPTGEVTQFITSLTAANSAWAIANGPDGNVWFTELGEAKIGQLTIPPGITGVGAEGETTTEVILKASVLANSQASSLSFEYGRTSGYGTTTSSIATGEGVLAHAGSSHLSGLEPEATYHYRAVAVNGSGTTDGPDETFTTAALPSEPPDEASEGEGSEGGEAPPGETPPSSETAGNGQSSGSTEHGTESLDPLTGTLTTVTATLSHQQPSGASPPVLGHSGVVGAVSGVVLVKDRRGLMVPLAAAANVPAGTTIDATHGVVSLTTALPGGHEQSAEVWGGMFGFKQRTAGGGMTDLYPQGPLGPCPARRGLARASISSTSFTRSVGSSDRLRATAAGKRAKRQLWSKDSGGRYTTHGANSAATVLGTEWLTVDSCKGTLTQVRRGLVRVRDLHTGQQVLVRAGHSYLARA
jgi:streptogramin lyase